MLILAVWYMAYLLVTSPHARATCAITTASRQVRRQPAPPATSQAPSHLIQQVMAYIIDDFPLYSCRDTLACTAGTGHIAG